MTATNHALTGAVIAVTIKRPELAIPLAFVSHFVLDALPHFGVHEDDVLRRNKSKLFRSVIGIDIVVLVALLILMPLSMHGVPWWVLELAMLAAVAPDLIWVFRFIRETRTKQWRPGSWFARFHQAIQRIEKPWGLAIEGIWALLATVILVQL